MFASASSGVRALAVMSAFTSRSTASQAPKSATPASAMPTACFRRAATVAVRAASNSEPVCASTCRRVCIVSSDERTRKRLRASGEAMPLATSWRCFSSWSAASAESADAVRPFFFLNSASDSALSRSSCSIASASTTASASRAAFFDSSRAFSTLSATALMSAPSPLMAFAMERSASTRAGW